MKCKGCKQQKKADNCQRCFLEAMQHCEELGGDLRSTRDELVALKKNLIEVCEIISIHHLSSLDKAKKYIMEAVINGRD